MSRFRFESLVRHRATTLILSVMATIVLATTGCEQSDPLKGNGLTPPEPPLVLPELDSLLVAGSVVISEVVVQNVSYVDASGDAPLGFIELQNTSVQTIDFGGVELTFIPVGPGADSFDVPFEQGFTVAPGEFLVISLSGEMAGDASETDLLAAVSPPDPMNGLPAFQVFLDGIELLDSVSLPIADAGVDVAFARVSTPEGEFFVEVLAPTPGAPNADPANPIELEFRRGDVNGDDVIDAADLAALEPFLTTDPMLPLCEDALDVNDDGQISIIDLVVLAKFVAGEPGFEPAQPFLQPGLDATADTLTCNAGVVTTPAMAAKGGAR